MEEPHSFEPNLEMIATEEPTVTNKPIVSSSTCSDSEIILLGTPTQETSLGKQMNVAIASCSRYFSACSKEALEFQSCSSNVGAIQSSSYVYETASSQPVY